MKAFLYLKSGTIVETDVEEISATSSAGECTALTWTKAEKGRRMLHVDPGQVSAVVVERESPSFDADGRPIAGG